MTDRKLLEAAARAAGLTITGWPQPDYCTVTDGDRGPYGWQPLMFDSDALRLAVRLGMRVEVWPKPVGIFQGHIGFRDQSLMIDVTALDVYTATRRAIVRAAAALDKKDAS